MTFLLVTLFAISLAVVIAGLLLSSRPQVHSQQRLSPAVRAERRVTVEPIPMRTRRYVEPQRPYGYRVPLTAERRAAVGISMPVVVERIFGPRGAGKPIPWKGITIGLVSLFILGLFSLNNLRAHPALWSLVLFNTNPAATTTPATPTSQNAPQYNASQNLVRLGQVDPGQYNSTQEFNLWAYSACSTAALTEVINAYGHHYRITDILKVEAQIGEITPQLGLVEEVGIQRTAAQFGFKTSWGHTLSLDQVINIANHGRPVIVSFPPDRYAGGHLLVVTGGDNNYVYLADSSLYNRHSLARAQFLNWWEGFSAILTPN
jgi:peptidase C39-like protein